MKNKVEKLRDLLGHAINILDSKYSIESITEQIVLESEVCGKRSIILCNPHAFDELHVTIWWGYKLDNIPEDAQCAEPLSTLPKNKIHDARVSGWIERKDGLWLQGKNSYGLSIYCANSAQGDLERIPVYKPDKISRTGKYYI